MLVTTTVSSLLLFQVPLLVYMRTVGAALEEISCSGKTMFLANANSELLQATTELGMLLTKECTNSTTTEDICTVSKREGTNDNNITTAQVNFTVDFSDKIQGRYVSSYKEACLNSGGKLCDGNMQATYFFHVYQDTYSFYDKNNLYYNTENYTWSILPNNASFINAKNFPICFDPGCQHGSEMKNYSSAYVSEWIVSYFSQYYDNLDFSLTNANFTCKS